jgi:hypothetical protein
MLRNLDTIYDIARSSKNFSTGINFSENFFWFTEVGGDGGAGRGLRVDAVAASGGGGGTATEAARGGGGGSSRGVVPRLFFMSRLSWRGGASARAGPFYPAEKVYVCRNWYLVP